MSSSPTVPPLTHHEIVELVGPFTRRGRHVDLAASNRLERRLIFKPVDHPGESTEAPMLREVLQLDSFGTGTFRLTRVLTRPGASAASVTAMGPNPEELLVQLDTVAPAQQFASGQGFVISRSYSLEPVDRRSPPGSGALQPILTHGAAQLDGVTLNMSVPATRGIPVEITLQPVGGTALDLPEDLLAVLGWDWARLIRNTEGWRSKLRLRGNPVTRSRRAQAALELAAAHLSGTLSEAPSRFHERWSLARWGVFFRRGIPVLTLLALLVIVLMLPHFVVTKKPAFFVLFFHVPTALIALSFCLQELPQYEIPPFPHPLRISRWRRPLPIAGNARPAEVGA